VTVSQKMLCSFLLSALLCAGFAALAFTGIIVNYGGIGKLAQVLLLVAVFLSSFLIIFFSINLRRDSVSKISPSVSAEAVQMEPVAGQGGSFFMFSQPFTFTSGNPELLHEAGDEVVYEEDGIHYINNNVFVDDKNEKELDVNFATLVESVVNTKELEWV